MENFFLLQQVDDVLDIGEEGEDDNNEEVIRRLYFIIYDENCISFSIFLYFFLAVHNFTEICIRCRQRYGCDWLEEVPDREFKERF